MRKKLFVLLLACCVCLSGCSPYRLMLPAQEESLPLPQCERVDVEPAVGFLDLREPIQATLWWLGPEEDVLTGQAVSLPRGEALLPLVLQRLTADAPEGLRSALPASLSLANAQWSNGIVTMDLALTGQMDDQTMRRVSAALTDTLLSLDGVRAVNVLFNGKKAPGTVEGALCAAQTDPDTRLRAQEAGTEEDEITLSVVVYCAGNDGAHLAPELREMTFTRENMLSELVAQLCCPPQTDCLHAPLGDLELMPQPPELVTNEQGERVVRLYFDANLPAALEAQDITPWQLYAALTLTLTGFVPDLDGVTVYLGEGQLLRAQGAQDELYFSTGVMHRQDFADTCAELLSICLPEESGRLRALSRMAAPGASGDPLVQLQALFEGPAGWEEGVSRVTPDGVGIGDVLGVRFEGDLAVVNLSEHFRACCETLTAAQERNLLYAMVNTLTDMNALWGVRFQIEGETVQSLVHEIALDVTLVRSPGLIVR